MTRLSMQGTKSTNTASLMVGSDIIRMIHANKKNNNKKNDDAADRIPSLIVNDDDDSTSVIDDDSSNVIDDQNYKNDISEQSLITTATTTNEMKKSQLSTKMLKISSGGVRTSLLRKAKVAASSESETHRPAEEKKQRSYMRKSTWENAYLSNMIIG